MRYYEERWISLFQYVFSVSSQYISISLSTDETMNFFVISIILLVTSPPYLILTFKIGYFLITLDFLYNK